MDINSIIEQADELRKKRRYEEALELYRQVENSDISDRNRARVLIGMATITNRKGEIYKAQRLIMDAINIAEKVGDSDILTRDYTVAIDIHSSIGDINACERFIKMGNKYVEKAGRRNKFNFYNMLGIFTFNQGKIGLAEKYWKKCLNLAKEMQSNELEAIAYNNLGEVARVRGKFKEAFEDYNRAYKSSSTEEDYRGMAINLLNMGDVKSEMNDLEIAEKYARDSAKTYEKHKDKRIAVSSYSMLSKILADRKKFDEALTVAQKAREISETIEDVGLQGEALMALSYVYEKRESNREAIKIYNQARDIFTKIKNQVQLCECELGAGRVLLNGNKKEAAKFHLEKAKKIASEIGEFKVVQKAEALLAKC